VLAAGFMLLALGDALTFATLLVAEVLLAARTGLFDMAGESALKEIVPDDAMGRAQAANQGRNAVLDLAGGPLGGVLLAVGAWLIGAVMALCHLLAMVTAWMLQRSVVRGAAGSASGSRQISGETDAAASEVGMFAAARTASRPNAVREIIEGFRWLLSRPDLRGVLFVATIINLGFATALTTIIYALQQNGETPLTIGLLATGAGISMLLGALVAPLLVSRVRSGVAIIGGLAVATLGVFVLIPVHDPIALVFVLGALVLFVPTVNAALMGYFMVATPTELLGRANSASAVLGMGAMPLAPIIAGFGLSLVGRDLTLVAAAVLCAIAVLLAFSNRALRALPVESEWAAHARQFEVHARDT
ncbi:MFS transporter, partial [Microbacterium sp.]|uniref:MFS transporter n=1 Tax=Microbacterium sp. TaxID=51671 RepID=UPI0026124BBE